MRKWHEGSPDLNKLHLHDRPLEILKAIDNLGGDERNDFQHAKAICHKRSVSTWHVIDDLTD